MEAGLKDNLLVGFFGICYMSQENWALKERKAKGIHCKQDTDPYLQHVISKKILQRPASIEDFIYSSRISGPTCNRKDQKLAKRKIYNRACIEYRHIKHTAVENSKVSFISCLLNQFVDSGRYT